MLNICFFVACLTMQSVLFLNHCFFHKWCTLHECSTSKQLSKCLSTTEKWSKNVERKKRLCTLHTMDNCFDTQWLERMIHVHNYSTTFLRESIQMDSKMRREKMQAYLYRKHNNKQRYRVATVFCIHDWIPSLANGWIALQLTFFFVVQPHSAARCKLHSCNHQLVSSAQFLQLEQRCSFFRFNALRR